MGRLAGRAAIVTGGARGIGAAIVARLVEEGARVAFLDIDENQGVKRLSELRDGGEEAHFLVCDVAVEEDVRKAFGDATDHLGRLDILVNNAGINAYFAATSMTGEEWEQVFGVDLKGVWHCCKYGIPAMIGAGEGAIINIASIHAFMTTTDMFPYAAAKSGVLGLTRSLAIDYGKHNIRVNAICPGWIRTHLVEEWLARQPDPKAAEDHVLSVHPLGRIGTPAEVADLTCFLASSESSFITGASILVDGGLSARFAQ